MPVSIWINICPNAKKYPTPWTWTTEQEKWIFSTYGNNFGIRFNEGIISRLDDNSNQILT
jgi:hypothetical protein